LDRNTTNANSLRDAHRRNRYPYADAEPNADRHTDAYSDSNAHSGPLGNADTDAYTDSNCNAYADTVADGNAVTGVSYQPPLCKTRKSADV